MYRTFGASHNCELWARMRVKVGFDRSGPVLHITAMHIGTFTWLASVGVYVMQIPDELLPDGFTQDRFGHPVCPCGNKTEVDGAFPCEHENPLSGLI